jgi:membrane associated rhomboid family serine protease
LLFIPLSDDNPLRFVRYQWVTIGIVAVNVTIFVLQISGLGLATGSSLAVVPAELLQVRIVHGSAHGAFDVIAIPEGLTLISYMFLHTDLLHLTFNMMFLWVFGDNVEDAMGHFRYLGFYILCGIAAALLHTLMVPGSRLPLMGASGAVAGTIAAYLMMHPRVLVWVLAFRVIPLRVTAVWILGLWVVTQLFMVLVNWGDQIAWWAHIGGMVAGGLLVPLMRRSDVALFDRRMRPDAASQDAWWHAYQAALFHRGLLRLRNPGRWLRSLARYLRARLNQVRAWVGSRTAAPRPLAAAPGSAPIVHRTADILCFEQRGPDFVLMRNQANGTRSEIVLTAANVVHLGLLAPGFARQVLTDKIGHQPGAVARLVRHTAMNANLRFLEIMLTILDRGGPRFNFPVTERRARALAERLVERADRIAVSSESAKEPEVSRTWTAKRSANEGSSNHKERYKEGKAGRRSQSNRG